MKRKMDVKLLFPETFKLVEFDKDNINNINLINYSNLFKSAFKDDLNKVIFRIPKIIGDHTVISNSEINFLIQFILSLEKISKGDSPAKIISDLSKFQIDENATETVRKFNKLAQYLNMFYLKAFMIFQNLVMFGLKKVNI